MRGTSNISYRIVDRVGESPEYSGACELYLVAVPRENFTCRNDFQGHGQTVPDCVEQARSLFRDAQKTLENERFSGSVIMNTVFLADLGKTQLIRQLIGEEFGTLAIPTTYVHQPPCCGSEIAVELLAVRPRGSSNRRTEGDKSLLLQYDSLNWGVFADIRPSQRPVGAYRRSLDAFHALERELKSFGFSAEDLFRTWLYQGHLVLPEGDSQRYKELNRARTDFFEDREFLSALLPGNFKGPKVPKVYPASTGIGTEDGDLVIGALSLSTERKDVIAVPLENPHQVSAFDYAEVYSPQSPKFARAMGLKIGRSTKIFVSGTAGITDSESRFENDPVAQSELTLENIAALISGENLRKHGIENANANLDDLLAARVYVKRSADYESIRSLCEKRCPKTPILYTIADVCRPELLVEIEAIAGIP